MPGTDQQPVYAFQPLANGAIVPGIGEPNLRAPEEFSGPLDGISPKTYYAPEVFGVAYEELQ